MTADPRRMRDVRAAIAPSTTSPAEQREIVGVVFPDPEEVDANLVGKDALFDEVPDRLGVRERAVRPRRG